MHSSTISRIEKARRYVNEPNRLRIQALRLAVHGEHAEHQVELVGQRWACDCSHFHYYGTCAHVMAAERLLAPLLPATTQTASPLAQANVPHLIDLDDLIPPVVPRD